MQYFSCIFSSAWQGIPYTVLVLLPPHRSFPAWLPFRTRTVWQKVAEQREQKIAQLGDFGLGPRAVWRLFKGFQKASPLKPLEELFIHYNKTEAFALKDIVLVSGA